MTDTKALSAPVSLGRIRKAIDSPGLPEIRDVITWTELEALVELAEAYLAVRALERSANRVSDLTKPELRKAERRLALAAKGVAP